MQDLKEEAGQLGNKNSKQITVLAEPLVSIIVPTRNSEKYLDKCLASIKNQTYQNIEIIVVDNNSLDKTKEISGKYTDNVFNKLPERSTQKNFGAQLAKGIFILFVDSDQELPHDLIKEYIEKAVTEGYDAILSEDNGIGSTFWNRAKSFEKAIHFNDKNVTSPRFIRKDVFMKLGGFDESLILHEDIDLHLRMKDQKIKIGHIDLLTNHFNDESFSDIIKKSYYYGKNANFFFKKRPKDMFFLHLIYHPLVYLRNWNYFLKHPIYGAASVTRKIAAYFAGGLGAFNTYLSSKITYKHKLQWQLFKSVLHWNPSYLILYVTSKCNSKCNYCFYWDELNQKKNELTLEEIEKITHNFKDLVYLNLTGGEPFLRPDIENIVYLFYKNSNIKFLNIPTNSLLPEVIRDKVKSILKLCPNLHVNIALSVDAVGDLHDKVRGIEGNFLKCLKTLEYLKEIRKENNNLRIIVHSVISSFNKHCIKENHDYFKDKGINQYRAGLVRLPPKSRLQEASNISIEEYEDIVAYINQSKITSYDLYSKLFYTLNQLNREVNIRTIKENKMILPCVAGRKLLVISEEGNVAPCEILTKTFGNLRDFNYNLKAMLKNDNGKGIVDFIEKTKCHCFWGCATQNNVLYSRNPKVYLRVAKEVMKLGKEISITN
ncbi:glycosyltransferase [Candidatus Woesearchaeota archaeon]|nr:glycosyltransferase [Candidatus Woesearchaeota archaeon]